MPGTIMFLQQVRCITNVYYYHYITPNTGVQHTHKQQQQNTSFWTQNNWKSRKILKKETIFLSPITTIFILKWVLMILITNIYTPHNYVRYSSEIPLTYHICYRLFGDPSYIRHVTYCLEIPLTYDILQIVWRSLLHTTYVTDCLEIPLSYHVCYRLFGNPLTYHIQDYLIGEICYRLFGNPSYIPHMFQIVWKSLLHTTYVTASLVTPLQ